KTTSVSAPTSVIVTAKDDTTLEVKWDPPTSRTGNIKYHAEVESHSAQGCSPSGDASQTCSTTSLSSYTNYTIVVRACYVEHSSNSDCSESEGVIGLTLTSDPVNVKVTAIDNSTLEVSWEHPQTSAGIEKYTACVQSSKEENCSTNNTEKTCTITNLQPSQDYNITVKSCAGQSVCSAGVNVTGHTKP
uniref:Fibronectin type-III domain-containing protein n=1 Tax=Mesocestoides corti TaxID=53468 RepID=A0A5K3G373_MESCO